MEAEQNDDNNNNNEENDNNENNEMRAIGRQRIEMKKIGNTEDLLISFSKRRSGIYKKASELSTLCGAEVGLVVFSPTGKPFSFGSPSVQGVLNRFMTGEEQPPPPPGLDAITAPIVEAHRRRRVAELSLRHDGLFQDLDNQRAIRKELKILKVPAGEEDDYDDDDDDDEEAEAQQPPWWEAPLEGLGMKELDERKQKLREFHSRISDHLDMRTNIAAGAGISNAASLPPPYFGAGSSSNAAALAPAPSMLPLPPPPPYFGAGSSSNPAAHALAPMLSPPPPPSFGGGSASNAAAHALAPAMLPPPYFGGESSSNAAALAPADAMLPPPPPPYFGGAGFGGFGN